MRKILFGVDLITVICAFLAVASLSLTIMVPAGSSELESAVTITGLHLWEFSSLGFFLMMAPFVILFVGKFHKKIQNMHIVLFGIFVIALIGYNSGIITGREWICSMTEGYVEYKKGIVAYPMLLMLAISLLVIRMDFGDFLDEYEEEYDNQ